MAQDSSTKSNGLTADQVKAWFNGTFFTEDQQEKGPVEIAIAISSEKGSLELPILKMKHDHSLAAIFHSVHDFLKQGGQVTTPQVDTLEDAPTPVQSIVEDPEWGRLIDVEQVEYRKKIFFVERYTKGTEVLYKVIRQEDNKILDEKMKSRGHVLSIYETLAQENQVG